MREQEKGALLLGALSDGASAELHRVKLHKMFHIQTEIKSENSPHLKYLLYTEQYFPKSIIKPPFHSVKDFF